MHRSPSVLCLLGLPLVSFACTGFVDPQGKHPGGRGTGTAGTPSNPGDPSAPPGSSTSGPGPISPPGAGALSDRDSVPGPVPLRRLTKLEYENTLRDLLGVEPAAMTKVVADAESVDAGFVRGGWITGGDDVRDLMAASTQAIDAAVKGKLDKIVPCAPVPTATGEQEACATKFISQFGKRAFRRPLTERESGLALELYNRQRGPEVGGSFEDAVSDVIAAFIQSPQFLYHWELGTQNPTRDGNLVRFNSYEIASRLSYLFWATMPDEKLFAAADANALQSPEQIATEAKRLLRDEKAKRGLADFHLQFLEIGPLIQIPKDETVKDYSPQIAQAMLNETRDFVASVFQGEKGTGKLEELLTSTATVIDPSLAKIYGVQMAGTGPQAVTLDPAQRSGIFTQLAFLTARADTGDSHPVKRGDTLLRRLLCTELTVPPSLMVPPVADAVPGGATTRQRFEMHTAPDCVGCHSMIDPLGFAFESYDAIGAYRTKDQGKDVDTSGSLTVSTGKITFRDARDLLTQLAKLPEVQECVANQWMRYMLGRREVAGEKPSLNVVHSLFKKSGFDFRELLVDMTRTRTFTHRSPSDGEVLQ
jgi:Protein of unknown function (DUF1592)/Protein of unknown function (DUF1588)/Protein of unknown function (DUF1595)/Protein of unknown function (DUF1585)/Protein of unknown function (DUF1587)